MQTMITGLCRHAHRWALLGAVALLAACANGENLGELRPELGDFRLAHNIVLTENTVQGPLSREADLEQIQSVLQGEIARRFDRYEGERLYHLAVNVDAYVLAVPGVPLVASPRSALVIGVHVWDDALGRPLNEEREQFTVLEHASGSSILGSGLTQSAEQQLLVLSRNAALRIEEWLAEHPEWFPAPAADPADDAEADDAAATTTDADTADTAEGAETATDATASAACEGEETDESDACAQSES